MVVGDWSGDGHKETRELIVSTNFSKGQIERAYAKGCKTLGFDVEAYVSDCEERTIPREHIQNLIDLGMVPPTGLELVEGLKRLEVSYEAYAYIWMFVASVGDPKLKYEFIPLNYNARIVIGGYGLF